MTVEADQSRVESRLAAGQVECPGCWGPLRAWGWARPREVRGIAGVLRPRRSRCSACLITHVLLPVTVLARRAYAVEVIGAALLARAGGLAPLDRREASGSGGDGAGLAAGDDRPAGGDPAALAAGGCPGRGGPSCPEGAGRPWRDLLAALGAATAAVTGRFGPVGVLGPVTAWQVAAACSGGRLLAPGWPPMRSGAGSNTSRP